jgi:hypothetical protein
MPAISGLDIGGRDGRCLDGRPHREHEIMPIDSARVKPVHDGETGRTPACSVNRP